MQTPRYTNGASEDVVARGIEVELNANPTRHWMMKLNVTKQEAFNARLAPELTQWFEERLAVWRSIIDPSTGRLSHKNHGRQDWRTFPTQRA